MVVVVAVAALVAVVVAVAVVFTAAAVGAITLVIGPFVEFVAVKEVVVFA